jgi:hypothetical protein
LVRRYVVFLIQVNKELCQNFDFGSTISSRLPPDQSRWPHASLLQKIEARMHSTDSQYFKPSDIYSDGGVDAEAGRQKPRRPYRPSRNNTQFREAQSKRDKLSIGRRVARSVAVFLFAVLIGVGGTIASHSYRDEIIQAFPPVGWLSPVSTMKASAPAVTTADLQEQLKPVAIDFALVRRSIEQLASNQDRLGRKQDQMAQAIATLRAAEQEVSQKVSAPPSLPLAPKPVHVSPKQVQPPAQ